MPCFLLLVFHLAPLFPQVQCSPWDCRIREEGCALHREGKGQDFLACYRYTSLTPSFFPTIHYSHTLITRHRKWPVSQIWMHILAKSLLSARIRAFSFSAPGNLSLRSTRKMESPNKFLALDTSGARTVVPFSKILSLTFSCLLLPM